MIDFILLFLPVTLLFFYKNKFYGFAVILTWLIIGHLTIALVLQSIAAFNENNLLLAIIAFDLIFFFYHRKRITFPVIKVTVDWIALAVILLSLLYLSNVHYNYSGKYSISEANQYQTAESLSYPYPYLTDEWDVVAMVKAKIKSESLALYIPYAEHHPAFVNYDIAFSALLAEIILTLNLDPATDYINISIFLNTILVLLIYTLLQANRIDKPAAATAALLTLFITVGSNLPGLWNLIPMSAGTITLLLGLIFLSYHSKVGIQFTLLLTILFYPPFAIFYFIAFLSYLYTTQKLSNEEKRKLAIDTFFVVLTTFTLFTKIMSYLLNRELEALAFLFFIAISLSVLAVIAALSLTLFQKGTKIRKFILAFLVAKIISEIITTIGAFDAISQVYAQFWDVAKFSSADTVSIPSERLLYNILPPFTLLFAFIGFKNNIKKLAWLAFPIMFGLIVWVIYSEVTTQIFILYSRNIFITSILITILSGFGLGAFLNLILKKAPSNYKKITTYIPIFILGLFFILSFFYTERSKWDLLIITNPYTGITYIPSAPVNTHLRNEDLRIFSEIHDARFLSLPWKGKVIGAMTNNYPLSIKSGIITLNSSLHEEFINSNCLSKYRMAEELDLDYVYVRNFACAEFVPIDENGFGMTLYQIDL